MKVVLKILLSIPILLLVLCFLASLNFGYADSMHMLIGDSPNADKILNLVSPTKFILLQILSIVCVLVLLIALYFLDALIVSLKAVLVFMKNNCAILINELRFSKIKWVLIFPVLSSIFFAFIMPVSYDEAYTYLQFTSKSIFISLSYYPVPNNHVLHSMITNVTRYIPFASVLFCLRISSIVVSFFTWIVCYSFIKKFYTQQISLVITGIASMLFMSVYYSYMSRGYGLVMFFFIISLYASYNLIFNENKTKYWLLFSVSNVLGFFTMPSYLYPFIILNVFILWNNKLQLKNQFVYNALTIVSVVILYLPIIIVNGLAALTSNKFVLPINRIEVVDKLPEFLGNTLTEISGTHWLFVCIFLAISFFMMFRFKMKFELKMFVLFIASPAILLIAHSVIPFPRTFNYYAFILVFLILIPYWKVVQNISMNYLITCVLFVQTALFVNFYLNIKKYETFNITYHEINKQIIGNNSYFFSTALFDVDFLFETKIHGYTMSKSLFNFPPVHANADTLSGFDYYIIDKRWDQTKNKKPAYSDEYTNVYVK